jgi:hypothetical protein
MQHFGRKTSREKELKIHIKMDARRKLGVRVWAGLNRIRTGPSW